MIPLGLKLAYTGFLALLIPVYARRYGPGNFLWFSDVALVLGCASAWLESPLLASTQAIAVLVPEMVWVLEFVLRLTIGVRLVGLTDYMFDASVPRVLRALSLFHLWLPAMLVWLVFRLGYDSRAFPLQIGLGTVLLFLSYRFTRPEDNVNWVHRWGTIERPWPLLLSAATYPLAFYLPAHLALQAAAPGGSAGR